MTPRTMARDLWNHPATVAFCLSWIAIFAAMTYVEFADRSPFLTRDRWLVVGFPGGHRFGDLTLREFRQGQIWRLITCNFIHYSLIHVTLNLLAMYQLGSMVEEWYGSYQFVFVYGLLGGLGNLVSAFIRIGVGANPQIHSGGGSVLIMGLVGMCAVAGWRARDRWGKSLSRLMAFFLLMTAGLGILLPRYIDNWGHAGGALVGAVLGFADYRLLNNRSTKSAWGMGVVMGSIIAACGAAQLLEDRRESPALRERSLIARTDLLTRAARDVNAIAQRLGRNGRLTDDVRVTLDALEKNLDGPSREAIRDLRPAVLAALNRPLPAPEKQDLQVRIAAPSA